MRQAVLSQVDGRFMGRYLALALLLVGLLAVPSRESFAQHGAPAGKKDNKKGAAGKTATTPGGKSTPQQKPVPATNPGDTAVDPVTGLPKDYKVPPEKPDVMIENEPLVTPEELTELKKSLNAYKKALNATGSLTDEQKTAVRKGIKYRLALVCEKENLQKLHQFREDLSVRDLQLAGKLQPAADVRNFRKFILTEIVKQADALLKKNLYVRIQAVTLVGELDLTEADTQRNLKLEAHADGLPLLAKVLADPEQPLAVKIAATRSIVRLLRYGVPSVPIKHEVANAVVAELKDSKKFFWYQLRLVEALSLLDNALDLQNRKPFIVDTLRMVMNDPERDWQVRAMAARSLGRVPFDPAVSPPAVIGEVAVFARDMAKAAQQQPKNPIWKTNFWFLYLAFNAQDGTDQDAARRGRGGFRNNALTASLSEPVYQLVLPIVNKLFADQPVTVELIKGLDDWVQKNKPLGGGGVAAEKAAANETVTNNPK